MTLAGLEIADDGWVVILSRSNRDAQEKWFAETQKILRPLSLAERRATHSERPVFLPDFGDGVHYQDVAKEMEVEPAPRPARVVTTQNPMVLDGLAFESAVDVRRRVLVVRYNRLENITEDEAQAVWASYQVGIQYVYEILKTQGLW